MISKVSTSLTKRASLLSWNNVFRHSFSSNIGSGGVFDLVVVGGGIVGCATAREMLERHPNLKIAIVEKEDQLAQHQTGHNSGVIHAGIYYKPGSIKSKLCVEGLKLSYEYCDKHNVPYKKTGKLVVANSPAQVPKLNELYNRGLQNKVPDLELVEKDNIVKYEPNCKGEKAIWSPWTGIVDWALVCRHFAEEFQKMGGTVLLNFKVNGFGELYESTGVNEFAPLSVHSKTKCVLTKYAVTCAGLHSDRLAILTGCDVNPKILPFRGEYLIVNDDKKHFCKTNIYPVPDPRFPFLGVHFTPRVNGDVWIGPNAVLALSREGYNWSDINIGDCIDMLKFRGLYKIVLRGNTGVRAQAVDNDGNLVDDFVFDNGTGKIGSRILHVRNAPSPAATSSMAIAKYISDKMETDFKF